MQIKPDPQYLPASYLGITPEYLSEIRKNSRAEAQLENLISLTCKKTKASSPTHMMTFEKLRRAFTLRDQILLIIILCCLAALVIGSLLFVLPVSQDSGELTMEIAQAVAEWTGLLLLLLNGTIMQTKYWQYILASILIIIMHSSS